MSNSNPTTADVPQPYDVVFTGVWDGAASINMGFCFLDTLEPSIPFRTHRAIYSSTATFLERTNVSGAYSDNQQDFFLTSSQNDWSKGEDQRFLRLTDDASRSRYWKGLGVDITTPGQVSMLPASKALSLAGSGSSGPYVQFPKLGTTNLWFCTSTNLYEIDDTGAITDHGAHGITSPGGMGSDGQNLYIAGGTFPTCLIYKYDNGLTKTTFSAATAGYGNEYVYINKTLYAGEAFSGTNVSEALTRVDTAGVRTVLFSWQAADAAGYTLNYSNTLKAYGGKIVIARSPNSTEAAGEIMVFDGTAPATVAQFPRNFRSAIQGTLTHYSMTVVNGIVLVAGLLTRPGGTGKSAVYSYVNGNLDLLWSSSRWGSLQSFSYTSIAQFPGGFAFVDVVDQSVRFYNLTDGSVSTLFTLPGTFSSIPLFSGVTSLIVGSQNNITTATFYPDTTTATTAYVSSSLMDFDNSLAKQFRGVKVDYIAGTDGNGGSVDISYQVDSVDGSYTSLQTNAVSGTEYTFSNVSGHAVSIKVTLNKGTSTSGPILKRIYVRAAPILQAYRKRDYVFDLTGIGHYGLRKLRDGSSSPFSGHELAVKLNTAITSSRPFTITDRLGSFTGVCEPDQCELLEVHAGQADPVQSGDFVAKIVVREI